MILKITPPNEPNENELNKMLLWCLRHRLHFGDEYNFFFEALWRCHGMMNRWLSADDLK